jgi:hypothetical protein
VKLVGNAKEVVLGGVEWAQTSWAMDPRVMGSETRLPIWDEIEEMALGDDLFNSSSTALEFANG